jgi:hypothetical protein
MPHVVPVSPSLWFLRHALHLLRTGLEPNPTICYVQHDFSRSDPHVASSGISYPSHRYYTPNRIKAEPKTALRQDLLLAIVLPKKKSINTCGDKCKQNRKQSYNLIKRVSTDVHI